MKKAFIAIAIVAAAALTSLTVSSKSTNVKHGELPKINNSEVVNRSFGAPKSDLSSAD
ncbi:hypothetical protein [Mucilaginibacter polytrichastri]|uniref:Phr family secreted Rap phosphatase inhibitor n=1 Tax=Mucilaginibacter polytrichastri TaxID=1302689 RepID=A0A1Q5ZV31_9SPHI|nr:hypothetical protein [Mucilaginibacter polytrichastri]OKS85538.1 hypothetical protein RG47T_0984 [Mucilaginibacter polytrichastri]SFS37025.1 hypothetical protein SAMN04487890_101116 [Mucilaginibacter polytrichastri]